MVVSFIIYHTSVPDTPLITYITYIWLILARGMAIASANNDFIVHWPVSEQNTTLKHTHSKNNNKYLQKTAQTPSSPWQRAGVHRSRWIADASSSIGLAGPAQTGWGSEARRVDALCVVSRLVELLRERGRKKRERGYQTRWLCHHGCREEADFNVYGSDGLLKIDDMIPQKIYVCTRPSEVDLDGEGHFEHTEVHNFRREISFSSLQYNVQSIQNIPDHPIAHLPKALYKIGWDIFDMF